MALSQPATFNEEWSDERVFAYLTQLPPVGVNGDFHVLYHAGLAIEWAELAPYLAETNWFAQSMLWWACKGVVAQPFEEALIGVYLDQPNLYDLIQTALTIGHSSGADHLLGVWLGLLLVRKAGLAEILI